MKAQAITRLLQAWRQGDREALDRLMSLVYDELKRLASYYLRSESGFRTLDSRALVHEAYLRMVCQPPVDWQSRKHFFGIAARLIRQILVDHARRRQREKRGAGSLTLSLDGAVALPTAREVDLVQLEDALNSLAEIDQQQSRIVELRFFAGLNVEETAEVLGVSPRTVKRDWAVARAWLFRELTPRGGAPVSR